MLVKQMMCNHVLYQNDAARFALPLWILHFRSGFFALPQQLSYYHSGFSIVAVSDPSWPPYRCVMGEVSV